MNMTIKASVPLTDAIRRKKAKVVTDLKALVYFPPEKKMNNPNQKLYNIYQNIQSFYNYRGLVSLDSKLAQDEFIKTIQQQKFILLTSIEKSSFKDQAELKEIKQLVSSFNEKSDAGNVTITQILLIYPGTECENKRINMLKMINYVRFPSVKVIIVTPTKISTSVAKGLRALSDKSEHRNHDFKAFTYTLFNCVLPEHELVPKYEIMSPSQIKVMRSNFINPEALPKIFDSDPQMVWIGATKGDIIKYTYLSEVTIEAIGYAKVVAQ